MKRTLLVGLVTMAAASFTQSGTSAAPFGHGRASAADTVQVAAPQGNPETDRASILSALDEVASGGTVRFEAGTYLIGEFLRVPASGVTLQGHPDGTTLRGCSPGSFDDTERAMTTCNGLALTGEGQTIRGLTFEHMWEALRLGCCLEPEEGEDRPDPRHVGGHLVEGNTFRSTVNGFRVIGDSPEPTVVRNNDFLNVWHAGGVNGRTGIILNNRISVPDPEEVPPNGFAGLALFITAFDTDLEQPFACAGNVIAGNRIEGHPEGIAIAAYRPGAICRENVVRENTIRTSRVRFTGTPWGVMGIGNRSDSTLIGVPITLADLSPEMASLSGVPYEPEGESLIRDNLIEGNRVVGAEGLGIEMLRASGNHIVDNTITGVIRRDPFPGNTMYVPPRWREANGSAIWVSGGSDGNRVLDNTFEDVVGWAVFVDGDQNVVTTRTPEDEVRDQGSGNRVTVRAGAR